MQATDKFPTVYALVAWAYRANGTSVNHSAFACEQPPRTATELLAARVMMTIGKLHGIDRALVMARFVGRPTDWIGAAGILPATYISEDFAGREIPCPLLFREAIIKDWCGAGPVSVRRWAKETEGSHMHCQRLKLALMRELDKALARSLTQIEAEHGDWIATQIDLPQRELTLVG